ncbi:MAG: putative spermidine/putrescine transport system substrate-binding protein, partial [Actinomycetota bacterium]|nr:putative spermidine/putrescine transport system substrate-binding protein [Actinomycetota bacterium]
MMTTSLRRTRTIVAAVTALTVLAACASSKSGSTGTTKRSVPKVAMATALGKGEGAVNIIVWAGYAEDGSNDKTVDWVHPFEQQTGCKVNAKVGNTSD